MDTSVPCPLEGSQRSNFTNQPEQGIVSSAPSLPVLSITRRHVQVMETPVANLNHLRSAKLKDKAGLESYHSDQSSSQVAKSSSQSRIVNTYASNDGDAEGTQETNFTRTNDEESNDIDVIGTQLSNGDWSMRDSTPNSHTAFALDSSAPKEHDSNAPIPMSTFESQDSSKPFSSHDEMISSMGSEAKEQDTAAGQDSSHIEHSQISPLKRPAPDKEVLEPPLAKRLKAREDEGTDASTIGLNKPASGVVSRRQDYIHHSAEHLEAQRVYEKFRNDYPSYAGDFLHFAKLCFMLQTLRAKGSLQRSFLWDDFVIKHLEEYPHYLEQRLSTETKSLVYEEYFTSTFVRPCHKKRSLTAEGIKVVAAQNVPTSRSDAMTSPSPPRSRNGAETSFTASLVDKFSNFHTHSFGPASQSAQSDTDADRMSFTMSSPTPITKTHLRTSADEYHSETGEQQPQTEDQQPEIEKHRSEVGDQQPEVDRHHSDAEEQHSEPPGQQPKIKNNHFGVEEQQPEVEVDNSEAEKQHSETEEQHPEIEDYHSESEEQLLLEMASQINSEDDDLLDETHEIASIELGDDEPSAATLSDNDNDSKASSEAESINENWFLSLRHIFPTEPCWSDDPNTPFKKWALADQNAFAQRKYRRDWARIPADDKGVPQRPCYSNPPK
jgi:hypothetical protein